MTAYKIPPLLPIPVIVLMVMSAALPVLAFVLILQANENTLKQLRADHEKIKNENGALLKKANERKKIEFEKENYRLLERAFQFRFFRTGDEARDYWKKTLDVISKDPTYALSSESSTLSDKPRKAKGPGFETEFVGQVNVKGNHRALLKFLLDINSLRRTEYFAEAACARIRLPETINWPTEKFLQYAAADARAKGKAAESGWYYEPCDKDGVALSTDAIEDSIKTGTRLSSGYIWYQGKGLDKGKVDAQKAEAPNDETWGKALDYILDRMNAFYSRAEAKPGDKLSEVMPFVRETFSAPPPESIDPHTGGYCWGYEIPVFTYYEQMLVTPVKENSNALHELSCRIVFPVRPPLKALLPGTPETPGDGSENGGDNGNG